MVLWECVVIPDSAFSAWQHAHSGTCIQLKPSEYVDKYAANIDRWFSHHQPMLVSMCMCSLLLHI